MQRIAATDFTDIAKVSEPALAPDGGEVLFVKTVPSGERAYEATVFRVPIGGDEARQFTGADGVDSAPSYAPDGDRVAFVSTRGEGDRGGDLWVIPTDGGEAQQVTEVVGAVTDPVWSPDGERIAFLQRSTPDERDTGLDLDVTDVDGDGSYEREPPDPRVIDRLVYRSEERYYDGTRSHVYVLDIEAESIERLTGGEDDFVSPAWGDAATLYYGVKRGPEPDDSIEYDLIAHDVATGETESMTTTTAWKLDLAATADGRVAYPFHPADRGTLYSTDIHVYDRDAGSTHELTDGFDRTVDPEIGFEWGPEDRELYFVTPDEGAVPLRRIDWERQTVETVIDAAHINGFSVGRDAVAVTQSEWDHPGDVFVATRGGEERNRLTRVNADYLDDRAIPQPEELWFTSNGVDIQGWLLTPPDAGADDTFPLVVEVHGGPHAMWSTSDTMWHEFQTLAASGYAVFWSNPRGSTGYGEAHRAAIERDWGSVTMADVMAGVDHVSDQSVIDDDSLFLTGGSFGGYMTGWIVGHSDRFLAANAQRGVYDLVGFYGATDQAFKLVEWDFGTTPLEDPDFLWDHSPVAYASDIETPLLLMHAENDYRVAINDAELFYRLLRKRGIDVRLVRYPREGHELSRSGEPGHIVDRLERIRRWFDGYSPHHDAEPVLERPGDIDE